MKAKKPESNIIPMVKLGDRRNGTNEIIPNAVKNVIAYGLCKVCSTLLSARASNWARNSLKCPNCKTVTHYYNSEWYRNKTPLVYNDGQSFNPLDYLPQGVTPRGSKPTPTATQPVETPNNGANQNQAMLVLLQNIYAELQKLNDKWS